MASSTLFMLALGRSTEEHIEALAKAYCDNQEDDFEVEALNVVDPLNEINLANYLVDFFVKFSHGDRQLFGNLCQVLTQAHRNAIQMVLNC
ncbi:hypothetical protein SLA2020_090420 [Shorea laevis]